jgi:hypothetical protein
MDRIARTGEFTPPGSTRRAREKSSADFASVREIDTVPQTPAFWRSQSLNCSVM